MLVSEIATRVKRQFGDEAGAQITDADIIRWVNDAQRDIAVSNNLLQVVASAPTVAGTSEYTLPVDVLTIRNVYSGTTRLRAVSFEDAVEQHLEESTATGEPQQYWIFANKFNLYPTPSAAGTIKFYYTKQPTEITATSQTPELPQQYHNRIVEYCLAQAYELDDNQESYRQKIQQFQDNVDRLKDNAEWAPQNVYPSITVSAADYGDGGWGYA